MTRELFVLLGAGASSGCASPQAPVPAFRPPVVGELFDDRYSWARDRYPMVQDVAAMAMPELARGAVPFEKYLREAFRDSEHLHERERYWSVPLYLQELMTRCSAEYTRFPNALIRLISVARRNEHVTFVSLNYDTILDQQLEAGSVRLSGMPAYVANEENWSLVKPHGSADWGRRVRYDGQLEFDEDGGYGALCAALGRGVASLEDEIHPRGALRRGDVKAIRNRPEGFLYPALSAPLGADDEITCPPGHIEALLGRMRAQESLKVLIVGYRCFDRGVLELIRQAERNISSVVIVCGGQDAGQQTLANLRKALPTQAPLEGRDSVFVFPGDLGSFTSDEAFERNLIVR